jgi:glutathione S-transferase
VIQLFGTANTRAFRSLWMLEELGVEYEHVRTDFHNGGTRTSEFLAINPNGHVPALVDGELRLWESMAVNLYLAGRYGAAPFWPSAEFDRARTLQWSLWAVTECERHGFNVLFQRGGERFARWREWTNSAEFRETHPAESVPTVETAAQSEAALRIPFAVLDAELRDREYILGPSFTAVDLNVASILVSVLLARLDLSPHPRLAAWLDRCTARPALSRAAR